jgi:hypothetical protein
MMSKVNEQHEELTQEYASWGDKLLQHTDVLYEMQVNRSIRPITIQLAPTEACFSADTLIPLLDGTEKSLKELSQKAESFWVYSYDIENKKIVPGKAFSRLTRKSAETIVVHLDNNTRIKCTPDHRFLLKSGEYCEAKNLTPEMSLMALYRRYSTKEDDENVVGYEMCLDVLKNEWNFTHRLVCSSSEVKSATFTENQLIFSADKSKEQRYRHHLDENKLNNSPDNLVWMTYSEHRKFHQHRQHELAVKGEHPFQIYTKTEAHRKRSSEWIRNVLTPMRVARGDVFLPKEVRKKGLLASNEVCRKLGEAGEHWAQKSVADGTHHFCDKNVQEKIAEKTRARAKTDNYVFKREDVRKKVSELQKKNLENGTHYFKSEEHRRRSSERMACIRRFEKFLKENNLTRADITYKQWYEQEQQTNHKIVKIEAGIVQDVYCLEVEKYHNFALSAGVFVHNCQSDCDFCSVSNRPIKSFMPWCDIVQTLTDFRKLGAKSLEITGGGNPLLYRDREAKKNINDIIELGAALGYDIGIITNSEKLTVLRPELFDKINWIRISLIRLDEGCEPEDYDFNGYPYEKLGFSYIIYGETVATPIRKQYRPGTSEETIARIARLVELHGGNIKFVRFAGNCLIKGNNSLVRKKFGDVVDANDKYKKFFLKVIEDDDSPYKNGCYVGMIRPYIAASPDGTSNYRVYICTSHVLQVRTYDTDYALCDTKDILSTWDRLNEQYKQKGYPYEVRCNGGRNWDKTCSHCYYSNNNKLLHTVAREMKDKNFP